MGLDLTMLFLELLIVILLVAINGGLAMSELAVVSSRAARLKTFAARGVSGAEAALALNADPGRFLSTVQIGITLVGILAGAFSGATLAQRLGDGIEALGVSARIAEPIGFALVVSVITYISLIVGELVPKQLALRNPERVACMVAPTMSFIARVSRPIVVLLNLSGKAVLALFGPAEGSAGKVTEEEIRTLVAEAESAGVLEPEERRMISGVLRLADRSVGGVMTPRLDIEMIDLSASVDEVRKAIATSQHSRLPAHHGSPNEVVGIIQAKDMLDAYLAGQAVDPKDFVRPAPIILETTDALDAVRILRESPVHIGLVYDEYGHFQGVVTTADILEAIAGAFQTDEGAAQPHAVQRADGSWLLEGAMPADEMAEILAIDLPPMRHYHTAAGFALDALGRLPQTGECFQALGYRFEVVDMDGRRIDKLMASRLLQSRGASTPGAHSPLA
jgi:putative hemolysin